LLSRWGWLLIIVAAVIPAVTLRLGIWHASVVLETAMYVWQCSH
jgi:hypothetical protein